MRNLVDIELGNESIVDVRVTASNEIDLWLAAEAVEMDDLCLRSSSHDIWI